MIRRDYYLHKLFKVITFPFRPLSKLIDWLNEEVDCNGKKKVNNK